MSLEHRGSILLSVNAMQGFTAGPAEAADHDVQGANLQTPAMIYYLQPRQTHGDKGGDVIAVPKALQPCLCSGHHEHSP